MHELLYIYFIFSKTNDFDRKYHEKIILKKCNDEISNRIIATLYISSKASVSCFFIFFFISLSYKVKQDKD